MPRMMLGALLGAIAMFITGFIFFGTPLNRITLSGTDERQQAVVQQILAANLPATGTYQIPVAEQSAATAILYGKGPIATIHYNTSGFAASSMEQLVTGFVHDILIALLMGFALLGIAGRVPDFGSRVRLVVLFSIAGAGLIHLGSPIWNHHGWARFIYLFIGDSAILIAGGLVIARWFLPRSNPQGVNV